MLGDRQDAMERKQAADFDQELLLIHYAENDDRINAGWPAYHEAAANLAWQRAIDFFNKEVRGA
jgi:hypothetical protein